MRAESLLTPPYQPQVFTSVLRTIRSGGKRHIEPWNYISIWTGKSPDIGNSHETVPQQPARPKVTSQARTRFFQETPNAEDWHAVLAGRRKLLSRIQP